MFYKFEVNKITLFSRDEYPVCYEIPTSLVEQDELPMILASMQENFLWFVRFVPHDAHTTNICPVQVGMQNGLLKTWESDKILETIRFRDNESNGFFIELIGIDKIGQINFLDSATRVGELNRFIRSEPGAVKMIILRLGDSPFWYIFVPQYSLGTVKAVLQTLHADDETLIKRKGYRWLHSMTLEEFYKGELGACQT